MKQKYGFKLISEKFIKEIKSTAKIYKHKISGAQVLSLINDDNNKVFGITFKTPPKNSTGIAHILEHSVLCGSRKFPVKEPFVELLKTSLQTFLNAFTYPDKTCYPVASQNTQDFYNLIDVYLDAVFYPNINKHIFEQEGWHYELENIDSPLKYKGVVYNEMKGVFSSPDSLLLEYSQQSIFPDNTYKYNSGGDPEVIPELTYQEFLNFHKTYYHPSNSRIFIYGNDNPEERLKILNEYLKNFKKIKINSKINKQKNLRKTNEIKKYYKSSDNNDSGGKITLNWLLTDTKKINNVLNFEILEYILIGMPASPLRKVIIESGLGEDLAGIGLENELKQMYFSTGIKGIKPKNFKKAEALILETLEEIYTNGINKDIIEAALNTIEFKLRENNTGNMPQGLGIMLKSLTTWLYNIDPLNLLSYQKTLKKIRKKSNNGYFEKLIKKYLIKNKHRVTILLEPDKNYDKTKLEEKKLSEIKKSLSNDELNKIITNTVNLKKIQNTKDSSENLAKIPCLKINDIDKNSVTIPSLKNEYKKTTILNHHLFTNNILYADICFDINKIPEEYIKYIPIIGKSIVELGTKTENYISLSKRINSKTGGIKTSTFSSLKFDKNIVPFLFIRSKSMISQTEDLFSILHDIICTTDFDNKERFKQILLEKKSKMEQNLIPSGHLYVNLRLKASLDKAGMLLEELQGINQIKFLQSLYTQIDTNWDKVKDTLKKTAEILFNKNNLIINITTDNNNQKTIEPIINNFIDKLPNYKMDNLNINPELITGMEFLKVPSQVNYVGKGINLYKHNYKYHGSINVIIRYLKTKWLWEQVRVKGGAYGAFCNFNRFSGIFTFGSYRDPNHLKTLKIFDEASDFLKNANIDQNDINKIIIGTIGEIDTFQLPDAKGYTSLTYNLLGIDDKIRQKTRNEILSTTIEDINNFASYIDKIKTDGKITILGSKESEEIIKKSNTKLDTIKIL